MRLSRRTSVLLAGVVVVALVTLGVVVFVRFFGGSQQERYCSELVARRSELTRVLSRDTDDGLIAALPILRDLADRAPSDIADEWQTLLAAITGLRDALDDAGADPATYDRGDPPAGVSDAEVAAIDAAATQLASGPTREALLGIDQHARDVCSTPLTQ